MKVIKVEQVTEIGTFGVKVTYSDGTEKIYYFGIDYNGANRFEHEVRMEIEDVPEV